MDFRLSEEQQALQTAAREFARGEMTAVAEETEREARPLSRDWVKRYAEMGFLGVNIPTRYGGLGLGNVDALLVLEEFAKISSAVAFSDLRVGRWSGPGARALRGRRPEGACHPGSLSWRDDGGGRHVGAGRRDRLDRSADQGRGTRRSDRGERRQALVLRWWAL